MGGETLPQKHNTMSTAAVISKVKKLQKDLDEYYKTTGDHEGVPDIESTCIEFSEIRYEVQKRKVVRRERYHADRTFNDTYKLNNEFQMDELEEQVKYDRRRLKKGWRIWKSENPDAELERAREIAMNLNGISFGLVQRYTDSELRECLRLVKLQADF